MNENWSEIVEILKNSLDDNYSKSELIFAVENCFRILGWRKANGSLVKKYSLSNSSTIDIVLSKYNKECAQFELIPVFVEEDGLNIKIETIDSVMKELLSDAALSFGKRIIFFYHNPQNMICKKEISLEQEDIDGIQMSDLFLYQRFNKSLVQEYITSLNEKNDPLVKLRLDIRRLMDDKMIVKSIFSDFLEHLGHDRAIIEEEMHNFEISILSNPSNTRNLINPSQNTKDTTRYSFNGSPFYPKKRFVLAVVKQYVNDHPDITYDELERIFPSEMISKKRGVIRPLSVVQEWIQNNPDLSSRFFLETEELITLSDGLQYTIYNQWALKQFNKFLEVARYIYVVNSDKNIKEEKEYITEQLCESVLHISKESLESFVKKKS